MPQSTDARAAVDDILGALDGDSIATLRNSGALRLRNLPFDEFVWAVGEIAADDGSLGWLAACYGIAARALPAAAADEVWGKRPEALVAVGLHGSADTADGRLTGSWPSVVGADRADWFLLACGGLHVLVPRNAVDVGARPRPAGLDGAGIADVTVSALAILGLHTAVVDDVMAAAVAAAAVVGSASGGWHRHVDQIRSRLAISYGGDEIANEAAAQIARTASDLDASRLQIAAAGFSGGTAPYAQAIARARVASDRLIASSRHALDASDAVTAAWRDVHAGCRLAAARVGGHFTAPSTRHL